MYTVLMPVIQTTKLRRLNRKSRLFPHFPDYGFLKYFILFYMSARKSCTGIAVIHLIQRQYISFIILYHTHIHKRYEELSTSAALRSERITCQLRNLVFTISSSGKSDYLKQAADVQGIQISSSEQILTITLPGLLPKRKVRTNTAFLHEPLNLALQTYILEHPIQLYQNCVVCFSQIYDQNLSLHRVRDYDNLEFKQILDTIAAYVLVDDTGLLCDSYHTTELGTHDHTIVSIMDCEAFPGWIKSRQKCIRTISEIS